MSKEDFFEWLYEEIVEAIYEAYVAGCSIEDIAEDWGVEKEFVQRIILEREESKIRH